MSLFIRRFISSCLVGVLFLITFVDAKEYTYVGTVEKIKENSEVFGLVGVKSTEKIQDKYRYLSLYKLDKNMMNALDHIEVGDYLSANINFETKKLNMELTKKNQNDRLLVMNIENDKLTTYYKDELNKEKSEVTNTNNVHSKDNKKTNNYNIGMKLVELKKYKKALEYFEKDDSSYSLYAAGAIYAYKLEKRDIEKAMKLLTKACNKGHNYACGTRANLVTEFTKKSDFLNDLYKTFPVYAREKVNDNLSFNRTEPSRYARKLKSKYAVELSRHMFNPLDSSIFSFDKIEDLQYSFFHTKGIESNKDNSILDRIHLFNNQIDNAYYVPLSLIAKPPAPKTYLLSKKGRVVGVYGKIEKVFNYEKILISPYNFLKMASDIGRNSFFYSVSKYYRNDKNKLKVDYKISNNTFSNFTLEDVYTHSVRGYGSDSKIQATFEDEIVRLLTDEVKSFEVIFSLKDRIDYSSNEQIKVYSEGYNRKLEKYVLDLERDKGSDKYEILTFFKDQNDEVKYTIEIIELDTFALDNI